MSMTEKLHTARPLVGGPVAQELCRELARRSQALQERGVTPCLAVLRAGAEPDALAYEKSIAARCRSCGVALRQVALPDEAALPEAIRQLNGDESVHGVLLLRPLARRETEADCARLLRPEKDVDGMTAASLAGLLSGEGGYAPCTAQACLELLHYYGIDPAGKRAAVIGRSLVVGQPAALLLQRENATVTVCHRYTADLAAICRQADILISAAGRPGLVDASCLRPGQVVVDVGLQPGPDGRLLGDVCREAAESTVAALSGGLGAVTTAVLLKHCLEAAEKAPGHCAPM